MTKILIDKEYVIDDQNVIVKSLNPDDNTVTVEVKDTDEVLILEKSKFRTELSSLYFKHEPIFSLVKKEDYDMLNKYNDYFWILEKNVIEKINKDTVESRIFKAIKSIAFSVLTTEDDIIYTIKNKIMATEDAIDFAIKNKVNIIKMKEKIVGTVNLSDVILFFQTNNPQKIKILSKNELIDVFTKAITDKNKETLKKYILLAKKNDIEKSLIDQAKTIINSTDSSETKKLEPITQPKTKEKQEETKKNPFVSKRRI
jgi:citrate lyase gamma subunit